MLTSVCTYINWMHFCNPSRHVAGTFTMYKAISLHGFGQAFLLRIMRGTRTFSSEGVQLWPFFLFFFFLFFVFDEGSEDPNTTKSVECWLGTFVNFQGFRTSFAKKPYILLWFSGRGSDSLSPTPPLDPRMRMKSKFPVIELHSILTVLRWVWKRVNVMSWNDLLLLSGMSLLW